MLFYIYASVITFLIFFFFFNDTATTEIYTLSLHDALPISCQKRRQALAPYAADIRTFGKRSEEHTSELQSQSNLVCRLLLEKKKKLLKSVFIVNKYKVFQTLPIMYLVY